MKVFFYVAYPYYFPHFLPIGKVFTTNGHEVLYVLSQKQNSKNMEEIAKDNHVKYLFGEEKLFEIPSDVIFFANPYAELNRLKAFSVFLEHGIGTKSTSFYKNIEVFDLYLVEGIQKEKTLEELYPQYKSKLAKVGFSKFDTIANISDREKKALYHKYKLDISKKTILYAPTFFPSSIEKMDDSFPQDFAECNILIKPHYLTYERKQYAKQVKKLNHWKKFENCIVVGVDEYNIVPFLMIADVMISDESSAMFEFAALNKPVISNRYFKLRWSYYLMPWKLSKRIDKGKEFYRRILDNTYSYHETLQLTKEALKNPNKLADKRVKFSKDLCGNIDGKVSERIYEEVLKRLNEL